MDYIILNTISSWRTDFLDRFFFAITDLGHWFVIAIVLLIVLLFLNLYKKSHLINYFIVVVVGAGLTNTLIKFLIHRARPTSDLALYVEKFPSFPSAHSALAFAFYGFLIYYVCRFKMNIFLKIFFIALFVAVILLVGFSRLYLGVHFPTDVLGGYLVGLLWVCVGIYLAHYRF